jgi:hypothetical protein
MPYRCRDAVSRFPDCLVSESDYRERVQSAREVGFYRD